MSEFQQSFTRYLASWREGNDEAINLLTPMIYNELHRRARHYMAKERNNHTISPTELVHEAFVKLLDDRNRSYENRIHFFALASKIMRDILMQYARARGALKRGGDMEAVRSGNVEDHAECLSTFPDLALAVDALEQLDTRKARTVELHYFVGLKVDEIEEVLGISSATVKRDLRFARAWLGSYLEGSLDV